MPSTSPNEGILQLLALRHEGSTNPNLASSPQCITPDISPSDVDIIPNFTFHHLIILIGTICAALAVIVSVGQLLHHAFNYYRHLQRNDMRVILVIAIFAIAQTISTFYYDAFAYIENIPKAYEAWAFASLFQMYVAQAAGSEDRQEQEVFFAGLDRYKHVPAYQRIALFFQRKNIQYELKHNHGSLRWFQANSVGVYQMPLVFSIWTPIQMILTAVICDTSKLGKVFKILNGLITIISTMTAVLSVLRVYCRLRPQLKPYHAVRKAVALKKLIHVVLFQSQIITYVAAAGAIYPTAQMTYGDYTVGIASFMTQCEMFLFSFEFLWAFNASSWKKEAPNDDSEALMGGQAGKMSFFRAFIDMFNFLDIAKNMLHSIALAYRLVFSRKAYTPPGAPMVKPLDHYSGYNSSPERRTNVAGQQQTGGGLTRYSPVYPSENLAAEIAASPYARDFRDVSPARYNASQDYNVRAEADLPPLPTHPHDARY